MGRAEPAGFAGVITSISPPFSNAVVVERGQSEVAWPDQFVI